MSARRRPWLPPRYDLYWGTEFWGLARAALRPGASVLDIGAGRQPTVDPGARPDGVRYVGLDVDAEELETAAPGSYDEIVVADVERLVPELADSFDLIVSWQALEHVRHLDRAAEVLRTYARPGGWFVAMLSGRWAAYAVANRLLPGAISARLVSRLRRRPLETVFRAHYDKCSARGLRDAFAAWGEIQVIPHWHAADYFERLPALQRAYLAYEDWAERRQMENLATHYTIAARR